MNGYVEKIQQHYWNKLFTLSHHWSQYYHRSATSHLPTGNDSLTWLGIPISVEISGTPIRSRILVPFLIPDILVGFFFNSGVEKSSNRSYDFKIRNSEFCFM